MATARQALRARREQLGLSQETVAVNLRVSTTTYRSWEAGTALPRPGRRPGLARLLEWSRAQLDTALQDPRQNGQMIPAWLDDWASMERAAAEIWAFEPVVVHGLMQTAHYAAAVERFGPTPTSETEVARRVELRVARQSVLARQPDPLRLSVILDESVLHRIAGDRSVMAGQLKHLAELGQRPNVTLQVLSLDAGVFSAAFGAFRVLQSPEATQPLMACTENRSGPHYLVRPHDIEDHALLFDYLADAALTPAASIELITSARKEFRHE